LPLFGVVVIAIFISLFSKHKSVCNIKDVHLVNALDENSILAPKGIYYDKSHTWTFLEKEGMVKFGIDDFIQHITGNITCVKMKEVGEKVKKGEKIVSIAKDGKRLNIYSPISGIIKEKNSLLILNSSLINTSTYTDGWVYTIEPKNWEREIQFLFMSDKYKEWIKQEFVRLKDFLTDTVQFNTNAYKHIILQDGGELKDNVLSDLEPRIWEDFQTNFIDNSK
jgi:glycine cleavage system H lipoate-binding protein